jgi:hypothetical protein
MIWPFKKRTVLTAPAPEHAVIVRTGTPSVLLDEIERLEADLDAAITASGGGELDGHEIAIDGSRATVFMYGADADLLFGSVAPVLKAHRISESGVATLRYGEADDPDAKELVIDIRRFQLQ